MDNIGAGFSLAIALVLLLVSAFGVGQCTRTIETRNDCVRFGATSLNQTIFDCKAQTSNRDTK
jgi:hypothetical protein